MSDLSNPDSVDEALWRIESEIADALEEELSKNPPPQQPPVEPAELADDE